MKKLNKKLNRIRNLSIFAIAFSGVMFIMWCCNAGGFSAVSLDTFVGVIVALLAIIVTIAIGWQIFNIYEVRSQLGKLQQLKTELDKQQDAFEEMSINSAHLHAISLSCIAISQKEYCEAFRYLVEALYLSLKHPSMPNLETILLTMEEDCIKNIAVGTIVKSDFYDTTTFKDHQLRELRTFNCIKRRYEKIYNEYIKKVCVDDDQK